MCNAMIKKWYLIFMLLAAVPSVLRAQTYQISGNLTGFKDGVKVDLVDEETDNLIQSTVMKHGAFTLKGALKNGPMYLIAIVHEGKKDYTSEVFAGGGDITIKGSKQDFPYNVSIAGPAEQTQFNAYQQSLKAINTKSDALMKAYLKVQKDSIAARRAGERYNKVGNEYRTLNKRLIGQKLNTFYSAREVYDYLPEMNTDDIKHLYNGLPAPVKNSVYGKRIQTYLTQKGYGLMVGDKIYDFTASDAAGKTHKLSSYTGKYILLDVSSVHCGPCVQAADELRMLTTKYKNKLNIVTFSADKKAEWLKGIKDEKVTWTSLNDGTGVRGKTLLKYDSPGFPGFYIISPHGVITETWVGYEKLKTGMGDLEKHLVKYLNKP